MFRNLNLNLSNKYFNLKENKIMIKTINKEESVKRYLEAVDIVCLDCAFLSEKECEKCPVRKTVDLINKNS